MLGARLVDHFEDGARRYRSDNDTAADQRPVMRDFADEQPYPNRAQREFDQHQQRQLGGGEVARGDDERPVDEARQAATPEQAQEEAPAAEEQAPAEEEAPAAEEQGEPYKIGVFFSVTGPASSLGVPERDTADMIVEQINNATPDELKELCKSLGVRPKGKIDKIRQRLIDELGSRMASGTSNVTWAEILSMDGALVRQKLTDLDLSSKGKLKNLRKLLAQHHGIDGSEMVEPDALSIGEEGVIAVSDESASSAIEQIAKQFPRLADGLD